MYIFARLQLIKVLNAVCTQYIYIIAATFVQTYNTIKPEVFNSHTELPWKTIKITETLSILIYDQSYSAWIRPLEGKILLLIDRKYERTIFCH